MLSYELFDQVNTVCLDKIAQCVGDGAGFAEEPCLVAQWDCSWQKDLRDAGSNPASGGDCAELLFQMCLN